MSDSENGHPLAAVPYLRVPEDGEPYLFGSRCTECQAVYLGGRSVCSNCMARDKMEELQLSNEGELYVYSIVHRSFPGIPTPYVSAVVDLDGGGTVKGNLINVEPDPDKIQMGMRVEVVYDKAPIQDKEGNEYMIYAFQPGGE